MKKPEILVFDVNETMLDLRALQPHFERVFGDKRVMGEWFGLMLRLSLVATVTRTYRPFAELGRDALVTTARKQGLELDTAVQDDILGTMLRLPPYPDVIPALTRLRDAGYRLVTLTNSAPSAQASQLAHAGLTDFFERQFSVEAVQLFKPAPETYHYAADQLGVAINHIRLIAAHDWDVTGAIRAGAQAAFVARPGMILGNTAETPDIISPDLLVVAGQLLP
ncbi:MAG: haloacid dehalogenase type II [Anaerolineae bacterium]|nr:haloacid dehalogenase type II [Anaerolineae bacterium]